MMTNSFLDDTYSMLGSIDTGFNNNNFFTLCTRTNLGSNRNIKHASIVKKEFKKNIFGFGRSNNIASLQKATGKTFVELMKDSTLSSQCQYITTLVSDKSLIDDKDQLYAYNLLNENSDNTLYYAGDYQNSTDDLASKTCSKDVYEYTTTQAEYTKYLPKTYTNSVNNYSHLDLGQQVYVLNSSLSSYYNGKIYFIKYSYEDKIEFKSFYRRG